MKLIFAIIPPDCIEEVKDELACIDVYRLTVMDVQGFGTLQPTLGSASESPGREFELTRSRRIQIMIGVNEEFVAPTIQAIRDGVQKKGATLDGKIFLMPLTDCIRIRTGERGSEAI